MVSPQLNSRLGFINPGLTLASNFWHAARTSERLRQRSHIKKSAPADDDPRSKINRQRGFFNRCPLAEDEAVTTPGPGRR